MVQSVKFTLNGVEVTLTHTEGNTWSGTVSAPSTTSYNQNADHKYYGSISAEDEAGNITTKDYTDAELGQYLKLRVLEKTPPSHTLTYPTAGAYITNTGSPTFRWNTVDPDAGNGSSGINQSTIKITIDGADITSGIVKTAITGGYSCEYTPFEALSQGSHTYSVYAEDYDGNVAASTTVSFTIDTVAPSLNVVSPVDNLATNVSRITVSGETDDATTRPVTVTVNGSTVSVDPTTGAFSTTVDLVEGSNTITVVATDTAGNSTTITRTVTLNTVAPTIISVTLTPNPVDAGHTYIVTAVVSDE